LTPFVRQLEGAKIAERIIIPSAKAYFNYQEAKNEMMLDTVRLIKEKGPGVAIKYGKWVAPELWLPEYAMYKGAKAATKLIKERGPEIVKYGKWAAPELWLPEYAMYKGAKAAYPYAKAGADLYFKSEAAKIAAVKEGIKETKEAIQFITPYAPLLELPSQVLYKGAEAAYPYAKTAVITGANLYLKSEAAKIAAVKEEIQFIKPYAKTAVKYGKWVAPELWLPEYAMYKGVKAAAPYVTKGIGIGIGLAGAGLSYVGGKTKESAKEQLKYMKILAEYDAALGNESKLAKWREKWSQEEINKAPFQPWNIASGQTQFMLASTAITGIKKGIGLAVSETAVGPWLVKNWEGEPDYYTTPEGRHIWASELKGKAPPKGSVGYRAPPLPFLESDTGYNIKQVPYYTQEEAKKISAEKTEDILTTLEWALPNKWGITAAEYVPKIGGTLVTEGPKATWQQYGFEIVGLGTQAVSGLKYKPQDIKVGRVKAWINNALYKPEALKSMYGTKALKVGQTISTQSGVIPTAVEKSMLFFVSPVGQEVSKRESEKIRQQIEEEKAKKYVLPELDVYRSEIQNRFDRKYKGDILVGNVTYEDALKEYTDSPEYQKILTDLEGEANRNQTWKSGLKILKLQVADFLTPETPGQVITAGALTSTILSPTSVLKATGYVQSAIPGRMALFGVETYIAGRELSKAFTSTLPKEERIPAGIFGTAGAIGMASDILKGYRYARGLIVPKEGFTTIRTPSEFYAKGKGIAQKIGVGEIPSGKIPKTLKVGNEKLVLKDLNKLQRQKLMQIIEKMNIQEKLTKEELNTFSSAYGTRVSAIVEYNGKILQGRDVKDLSWGNIGGAIEFVKQPHITRSGRLIGGKLMDPRKAMIKEIVEELGYYKKFKVNGKDVWKWTVPKSIRPTVSDLEYKGFFGGIRNHIVYGIKINAAQYKSIKASSDVGKFDLVNPASITAGTQSAIMPLKRAPQTLKEWGTFFTARGGGLYNADSAQIVQKFVTDMPAVQKQISMMSASEKASMLSKAQKWIATNYGKEFIAKYPGELGIQEYLLAQRGSAGAVVPMLSTGRVTDYFESAFGRTTFVERIPKGEKGAGQFKRFETKLLTSSPIPKDVPKITPMQYAQQLKKEGKINIVYDPYLTEARGADAAFAIPGFEIPVKKPTLFIDSALKAKVSEKKFEQTIAHELTHYRENQLLGNKLMGTVNYLESYLPWKYRPSELIAEAVSKKAIKTGYGGIIKGAPTYTTKVWQGPVLLGPGSEYKFGAPVAREYVRGTTEQYAHGAPKAIPGIGQEFTVRKEGLYFQPPVYPKGPYYVGISYLGYGPAEPEAFAISTGRTPTILLGTERSPTSIIPKNIPGLLTTTTKSKGEELEVIAPYTTRIRYLANKWLAPVLPLGTRGVRVQYVKVLPSTKGMMPSLTGEVTSAITTAEEVVQEELPIFQTLTSTGTTKTLISPYVLSSEAGLLLSSKPGRASYTPAPSEDTIPSASYTPFLESRVIPSGEGPIIERRGGGGEGRGGGGEEGRIITTEVTPSITPPYPERITPPSTETIITTGELSGFDWGMYKKKKKKKKLNKGYKVLIRKGGKFKPLTPYAYPKEEAIAKGARAVLGTARATFKIAPSPLAPRITGERVSPLTIKEFFRAPKGGEPGVFIQRQEKRITSLGEKREITRVGIATRLERQTLGLIPRRRNSSSKPLSLSTSFPRAKRSKFKFY
jgi:hypothetical protein